MATGLAQRPASPLAGRILRHGLPRLAECDPITGIVIRASKAKAVRHERPRPGELVHMDVKKIGRIPAGGGWRVRGRAAAGGTGAHKRARVGFDYVPLRRRLASPLGIAIEAVMTERVGIPPAVPVQRTPHHGPRTLAGRLQLPTPPHRTGWSTADQPSVTDLVAEYN